MTRAHNITEVNRLEDSHQQRKRLNNSLAVRSATDSRENIMIGLLYNMTTRLLLLFMLSAVMKLNGGESGTGHSLVCYKCHSVKSWEDCDKKMDGMNCSAIINPVCMKIEKTWRDNTETSSEVKTAYSRLCYPAKHCTLNECREKNWECKVGCCNTNLCNASTIMCPYALLIGVFLCFALEAICAF